MILYWFQWVLPIFFLENILQSWCLGKTTGQLQSLQQNHTHTILNYIISVFYIVVLSYKLNKTLQLNLINVFSTTLTHKENYDCFIVMEKYLAKHFVILQWLKQAGRLKPGTENCKSREEQAGVFNGQSMTTVFPTSCTDRFGMVGSSQLIICQTFVSATKPLWQED